MNKTLKIMTMLTLSLLVFASCEKIKDIADVKFDTSLSADLNVVVPPGSRAVDGVFDVNAVIDPASDPDIEEYLDNIEGYAIQSVTATVTAISKDVTLTNTTISCFNATQNANWFFASQPIALGTVVTLPNTDGQWNTISSILMTGQTFTVSAAGTTSEDDVTFTIEVTIDAEVTANPL